MAHHPMGYPNYTVVNPVPPGAFSEGAAQKPLVDVSLSSAFFLVSPAREMRKITAVIDYQTETSVQVRQYNGMISTHTAPRPSLYPKDLATGFHKQEL